MYLTLKFLHIFFTIIAVGFTSTFGLIMARAAKIRGDREMKFALQILRVMGIIAHVSFLIILVTGFGLIHVAGYPWYLWLKVALALFAVAFLVGLFVLAPTVNRRLAILETRGLSDPEFIALSKRSAMIGMGLSAITLVILYLMIAKPM